MEHKPASSQKGIIQSVRGSVVDIRFEEDIPGIYTMLRTGNEGEVVIEVLSQRSGNVVRGISLTPTQGLSRGMPVENTGRTLQAPVGKEILSRMFDVLGNTIDQEGPLPDVQWRSIHNDPTPLARRSTKSEIFETGIKAIDVLVPLERGGKSGLFGGAGVGRPLGSSPLWSGGRKVSASSAESANGAGRERNSTER